MRRLWESQTTRLGLLALAAATPLLAALIYLNVDERRQELGEAIKDQTQVARLAAARTTGVMRDAGRLVATLQHIPELSGDDRSGCERILRGAFESHSSYLNIAVVDPDGSLFCAARPINSAAFMKSAKPWLKDALAATRPVLSEPFTSVSNGHQAVAVAGRSLTAPGHASARIIAVAIDVALFGDILGAGMLPDSGTLSLLDRSHRVIVAYPMDSASLGALIPLQPEHIGSPGRPYQMDHPGGPLLIAAVTGIDSTLSGYDVVLGVSESAAFATASARWTKFSGLIILAVAAALALVAVVAGRLIVRPSRDLARVAQRLADGDFSARSQLANDMVGMSDLGGAINHLGSALERRATEVEIALDKLRASEDQYRLLFDRNPNPMWVFDAGTLRFLMVNCAAVRRYGYSRDEFLSMTISDIRPPEDVERLIESASNRATAEGENRWRHLTRDGRILEVEISANQISFGHRPGVLVCAHDITARVHAERAVLEAEERFRFALEAARVGVWDANLQTGVAHWSEIAETMHGLPAGSFGANMDAFVEAIYMEDRESTRDTIADAIAKQIDADTEYRLASRPERRVRAIGRYTYDADGNPLRGAGIVLDVTDRREMEEHLRHAQKLEAVGQLAGGVAHDFNNLLTVITGNAELARLGTPDPEIQGSLAEILKASSRAAQLTKQLLVFSRKQVLRISAVDVDLMIRELLPMLKRLIEEDIQVEYDGCAGNPTVMADRAELEQAIINLTVNARDAQEAGGVIRIEVSVIPDAPNGTIRIAVVDRGSGMSPEVLARAFEPFFTTKPLGKGTGLGLASVYGSVKQAGGDVVIDSTQGVGTTVAMLLPATRSSASVAQPPEPAPARGRGTILLVEDQESVRAFAARVLRDGGYDVLEAGSATDAVRISIDHPATIDLIFTDVVMPGPSIVDAIVRIRAARPAIAVVLTSGYPDAEVRRRLGATEAEIFPKPYSIRDLLNRVANAIAARGHRLRSWPSLRQGADASDVPRLKPRPTIRLRV